MIGIMCAPEALSNTWASMRSSENSFLPSFPENTYLVDENRNLVYAPIPKVACTSLKIWFLLTAPGVDIRPDPKDWKVNAWLAGEGNRFLLKDTRVLDGRMFRFAFVRNPWSRLVSAYLNRIVGRGIEHRQMMKRFTRGRWYRVDKRAKYYFRKWTQGVGWPESTEPTFREFVHREVVDKSIGGMDPHWYPQHLFINSFEPDFVGKFERLEDDVDRLCLQLGIPNSLPHLNRSAYRSEGTADCYADCAQSALRSMDELPRYRQFYTPDLIDMVGDVYRRDIQRFGYDF